MTDAHPWLSIARGEAPLILSIPHAGSVISPELEARFVSPWLARKDADWWVDRLYDFAPALGATVIRTLISRTVIDVNRDPTGRSLYPGQNTTELCPTTTFEGEPLYREGEVPDASEITARRARYFDPYHAAVQVEIERLCRAHANVVLFEGHSIRSKIPRLFAGELPDFNIGSNDCASCAVALTGAMETLCDASGFSRVTNGRFKGGYTTRHYGDPAGGVHAVQLELAARLYMHEPEAPSPANWPGAYDAVRAARLRTVLKGVLEICIAFAVGEKR